MADSPYKPRKLREEDKARIRGASHTPRIAKGAYNVGCSPTGRLDYNKGPTTWQQTSVIQAAHADKMKGIAERMAQDAVKAMQKAMFGSKDPCGKCIEIQLTGAHDARREPGWTCQMCGTEWKGLEKTDRRGAIRAQKERRRERNDTD